MKQSVLPDPLTEKYSFPFIPGFNRKLDVKKSMDGLQSDSEETL